MTIGGVLPVTGDHSQTITHIDAAHVLLSVVSITSDKVVDLDLLLVLKSFSITLGQLHATGQEQYPNGFSPN